MREKLRKKRVLFVGPYPPPYSGPDIQMKTLLESSLAKRFNISFLNTNIRKSNADRGRFDLVMIMGFFSFFFNYLFRIITRKPRLVYYFASATRLGWMGRDIWCILLARLFGAKVIIHMRAGHFKYNFESFDKVTKTLIGFACSLVSLGFVQARKLRDQFEGLVEGNRIVEVYNAIDTKKYVNESLYEYDPTMILFLGHLSFAKGYCDILKAIPRVASRYPDIRFHFAGTKIKHERNVYCNQTTLESIVFEDPDEIYERFVSKRYQRNHVYLGTINEQEKIAILKRCNFLVLPSYSEGFSVSVLEALAMGKPVICTPVGALGEIIRHGINGFLVPPGDVARLAAAIIRLLSNQHMRDRMAVTNYDYVRQNFTTSIISEKIAICFNEVIVGE